MLFILVGRSRGIEQAYRRPALSLFRGTFIIREYSRSHPRQYQLLLSLCSSVNCCCRSCFFLCNREEERPYSHHCIGQWFGRSDSRLLFRPHEITEREGRKKRRNDARPLGCPRSRAGEARNGEEALPCSRHCWRREEGGREGGREGGIFI